MSSSTSLLVGGYDAKIFACKELSLFIHTLIFWSLFFTDLCDYHQLVCFCFLPDPFEVAFVETLYTVIEGSVGQVEVCVNLTEPLHDIQDERVHVLVFDDMESVYIPPNTVMASKLSHTHIACSELVLHAVSQFVL